MQDHSIHDLYFAEVIEYLAACVQLPHCRQQVKVSPDSSSVRAAQLSLGACRHVDCTVPAPHHALMRCTPARRLSTMLCMLTIVPKSEMSAAYRLVPSPAALAVRSNQTGGTHS